MLRFILSLIFLISPFSAWAEPAPSAKVGAILGLTGVAAGFAAEIRDGLILSNEQLKERNKPFFDIELEDSRLDPNASVAALQKLVDLKDVRVLFVSGTSPVIAAKPLAEARGVLVLGMAGTSDFLEGSRTLINFANDSNYDARVMADAVVAVRPSRVTEIYVRNDWGESYHRAFVASLRNRMTAPIESEFHFAGETDFRSLLTKILREKPSAIVLNSLGVSMGKLIRQLVELKYSGTIFANHGLVLSSDALEMVKSVVIPRMYYQTYAAPPREFLLQYEQRFHQKPSTYSLIGFTYLEILSNSFERVGQDSFRLAEDIKNRGTFKGSFMEVSIAPRGSILVETIVKEWKGD